MPAPPAAAGRAFCYLFSRARYERQITSLPCFASA
ncbi:hypothetical protein J8I29_23805 [Labrys sp. LIt4]|nr:hypothetical protein [Labrys sp. LIt4]